MASYHWTSTSDRIGHKHDKQCRHSHEKHATDDMARNSIHQSHNRPSYHRDDGTDSDSSDEILIKGRASRHFRSNYDKDVARHPKSIEKAQRDSHRSSSSSSKDIQIHHVSAVAKSASPPPTSSRQSQSRSSNSSKSGGFSASEFASQLKGITKSWLGRRSDNSHHSSRHNRSRTKHEKRDKHGKKRVSTSKFLAPLAQRWVCYKCGKLRSETIQQRHPLKEGQKMQPNWCGKCRVNGELHGRTLVFDKQRHYCWGCGIVRSKTYHIDNPIGEDEMSTPNYCKPCREASPAFDYNLREASDIGSVASVREKALSCQMHDADLSDIDEEDDDQSPCASGKENQNPKSKKKLKVSKSFMLENCSYKVKSTSDASSDSGVPISILKALHLDEERARSTSGGGCRLSDGSYQPPIVESSSSENYKPGHRTRGVTNETLSTIEADGIYDRKNTCQSVCDEESSSPTVIAAIQQDSGDNSTTKKVHWIKRAAQAQIVDSNASDSAYCSGFPSDVSNKSAVSRRSRRDPGDVSTGSPPIQEGESTTEDFRNDIPEQASVRQLESRGMRFGKSLSVQKTFQEPAHNVDADIASYSRDSIQSSHSIPPTPPGSFEPATTGFMSRPGQRRYESPITSWVDSSEVLNFSRPQLSPPKQRTKVSRDPDPVFASASGTPFCHMHDYSPYRSAAHFSDSTQSRDFSGFSAPGEDHGPFQYERYGPTVENVDCTPVGCPIYDDYGASAEGENAGYFGSYGDSSSYGGSSSFPSSTGYSAFDFSGLGGPSSSHTSGGDGSNPESEKFVRKKKTTQSTPRQHSWRLYDDGDDDGSDPNTAGCEWRKDGRTTIHRSGGGKVPNEGNTVQILSICELDSDEEMSVGEDNDDISELGNDVGDDSIMKSICAA